MNERLRALGGSAVVLGVYALATLPMLLVFPPPWPDEVIFYVPAARLAQGQGMGTPVLAGFLPGIDRFTYWQPPGYFFFLSLVLRFVAPLQHLFAMRFFSWILGAAVLVLGAALLRRLAPNTLWTFLGLVVLGTHVSFMQAADVGRMEMLALAATIAALNAYLAFRQHGGQLALVIASLCCGLAMISHPAGVLAPFVIVVHEVAAPSRHQSYVKSAAIFAGCCAAAFVPWFIYIARAPHFFVAQMAAQSIRKSLHVGQILTTHGYGYWLLLPFRNAACPLGNWWLGLWPVHIGSSVLIPVTMMGVGLLALVVKARTRSEATILGSWALAGYALNLFMPEFWYTVHFITPACLLLGWALAEPSAKWLRAASLATLLAVGAWNFAEVKLIWWDTQDSWMQYKFYCLTIDRLIPKGSNVLLAAIPDPYFGLVNRDSQERLYEFLPVGVTVDQVQTEKAMDTIDYVVGSACCRPAYLVDYLSAHGRIIFTLGKRDFVSPPVVIWKLR